MSTFNKHCWHHAGVSKNNGAPKSSIWIGFSVINHPFWGIPIFGNTHAFDPIWIKTRDLWCRCHIGNRRRKCRNRRLYRCCDGNPKVWHDSFGRFGRRQCPTRSSEELVYIYIWHRCTFTFQHLARWISWSKLFVKFSSLREKHVAIKDTWKLKLPLTPPLEAEGWWWMSFDCWSIDGPKRKEMLHSSNFYK